MLPIKKLYIDTKYKTKDSISNSDFKIELNQSLTFPENTVFFLDDVSIPHSWHTIEKNINDKLYVIVSPEVVDADLSGVACRIVTISPGNYNGLELAAELQVKTRESINNRLFPNLLAFSYNARRNNINIWSGYSGSWKFKILTPNDIYTKLDGAWFGPSYDIDNPQDINEVIGNVEGNSDWYNTIIHPYDGEALNLQPIRNIYIHGSVGNYNTLGPNGETSIIKKIPVSANSGEYIFDQVLTGNDFGDCSKKTLRTISFQLKDVKGNLINFHGNHLSFSLIFSRQDSSM